MRLTRDHKRAVVRLAVAIAAILGLSPPGLSLPLLAAKTAEQVPLVVCKALPGDVADTARLLLSAHGFPSSAGVARFAVYTSAADFTVDDGWVCKGVAAITAGRTEFLEFMLPPGTYAVAVAHDANNNGQIDRAIVPTEAYGFSNYAKAPFGRPAFERARFVLTLPGEGLHIPVSLHPTLRVLPFSRAD